MDQQSGQIITPENGSGQAGIPVQPPVSAAPQPGYPVPAAQPAPVAAAPLPPAQPPVLPQAVPAPSPFAQTAQQVDNSFSMEPQEDTLQGQYDFQQSPESLPSDISWMAAEFIEHQKSAGWYSALAIAAIVLAGLDFLLTHDFISTSVILVGTALFGAYASHKPRTQTYRLSPDGLSVGDRLYDFQDFKDFSVAEEGAIASINLTPLRRVQLPLTIYVEPNLEQQVLDYLSIFLPFERHKTDVVDNMLRRIKF